MRILSCLRGQTPWHYFQAPQIVSWMCSVTDLMSSTIFLLFPSATFPRHHWSGPRGWGGHHAGILQRTYEGWAPPGSVFWAAQLSGCVLSPQGKKAFLISSVSYFAAGELKQSSWHPIPYRGEKKISSFYLGQSE